jgi:hypothetical protein
VRVCLFIAQQRNILFLLGIGPFLKIEKFRCQSIDLLQKIALIDSLQIRLQIQTNNIQQTSKVLNSLLPPKCYFVTVKKSLIIVNCSWRTLGIKMSLPRW